MPIWTCQHCNAAFLSAKQTHFLCISRSGSWGGNKDPILRRNHPNSAIERGTNANILQCNPKWYSAKLLKFHSFLARWNAMFVFCILGVFCARESLPWQPPVKTFPFPFLHFLADPLPACEGSVMTHLNHIFGEQEESSGGKGDSSRRDAGVRVLNEKTTTFQSTVTFLAFITHTIHCVCVWSRNFQPFS